MANTVSPCARAAGRARRWWRGLTRADLLVVLLAAALCSASYCLAIWHNSRGAADSRVLGPGAAAVPDGGGSGPCGRDRARAADDEPLDFEARHTAEAAGLSVSASASASASAAAAAAGTTAGAGTPRRPLRGAVAQEAAPDGERMWARADGGRLRWLTDAGGAPA